MTDQESMQRFDTKVQYLKYRALLEVARRAFDGTLSETVADIPKAIIPGKIPTMRCCVYKERAIISERVKLAMGGNRGNPNVIEVLDIACDECPVNGYEVTEACRGCIAHRCEEACRRGAISFDAHQKAHIDQSKCVECGLCAKACPYHAISQNDRPCQNACRVKAVSMDEYKTAMIDNDKCIACGACVYQCPFGAIMDKSGILDVIRLIQDSEGSKKYKLYAAVAPSIASQFRYAASGQVVAGVKRLGFSGVYEAALGADMVADEESAELVKKGFLLSSCCPAFVTYVKKQFPALADRLSAAPSPMAAIGRYIKSLDPEARVVFIGPCTAKKQERRLPEVAPYVDAVLTFEELQALIDSRDIDLTALEPETLDDASFYGRIFARSGGLSDAIAEGVKEHGAKDFTLAAVPCDGIEECRIALLKLSKGMDVGNFIEGMACEGGCINGAGCLTHGDKNRAVVDQYGAAAGKKTIAEAVQANKK